MARARRAAALSLAGLLALEAALAAVLAASAPSPAPAPALPPTVELPGLAVGFYWTYHYEGATDQSFAGYHASYVNDTYTSEVVGEEAQARGAAWVLRNAHAGTMSGDQGGFPITAEFTSLSLYSVRKSDLAVLNFTQDFNITAHLPFSQTVQGAAHNDTVASPPFAQVAFGAPADGTPWHIATNMSSTGWVQFGTTARINTSSYLALDYNLSVKSVERVTVPAGAFPSYNISGNGTADSNGTLYNFSESFFWAPKAMGKAIDEAGYLLMSYYVNRPPAPTALPLLQVPSGASAALNLSAYFADPEGDPFALGCRASAPLNCSVAPNGTLTVAADPGVNATLRVNLTADDALPGGNATYPLTVLVSGPGSTDLPPALLGGTTLTTPEDTPYTFVFADHVGDPDDASLTYGFVLGPQLAIAATNSTLFTVSTPPNFTGNLTFAVQAFDAAGNLGAWNFTLVVTPVNDPPALSTPAGTELTAHEGAPVSVPVFVFDVDGDNVAIEWYLDGNDTGRRSIIGTGSLTIDLLGLTPGNHTLQVAGTDPSAARTTLNITLHILFGPRIVDARPATPLHISTGSTVEFSVLVFDPDSPVLDYAWRKDGATIAQGTASTAVNVTFSSAGSTQVNATVSDGDSVAAFAWAVTVESVPPDLVAIRSPAGGSTFPANASVSASALVDARLSNLTLSWTLNGAPLASAANATTAPLAPGNYTLELRVGALFDGFLAYSTRQNVSFRVLAPEPVANNTTGGGGGNTAPPPPATWDPVLLVLPLAAVAGAIAYLLWRRTKRRATPK